MLSWKRFSQMCLDRAWGFAQRFGSWGSLTAVLFAIQQLCAGRDLLIRQQTSPQSAAFARYIASLEHGSAFAESGPIAVLVEASIPALYKESVLLAVRQTGANERSEFRIVGLGGDGAVAEEVIARYFTIEEQMENLPRSSILISPENYKFQFRGQVKTGNGSAYVYDITPRKRRAGLFKGQIWIDAITGAELLVSGHLTDSPSASSSMTFVRETTLDAPGYARVTHMTFAVPLLGRSELVVTERPLLSTFDVPALQGSPQRGSTLFNLPKSQGALGRATPVY
jgi:hypothetical protein